MTISVLVMSFLLSSLSTMTTSFQAPAVVVSSDCADNISILRAAMMDEANSDDSLTLDLSDLNIPRNRDRVLGSDAWKGAKPQADLVDNAIQRQQLLPLLSCFTGSASIAFSELPGGWAGRETTVNKRRRPGQVKFNVASPIFDSTKTHALLIFSRTEKLLGGKSELLFMTRVGTHWEKSGALPIWVS